MTTSSIGFDCGDRTVQDSTTRIRWSDMAIIVCPGDAMHEYKLTVALVEKNEQ